MANPVRSAFVHHPFRIRPVFALAMPEWISVQKI